MDKVYPLILAGGAGRRLYPLSRPSHPKAFLKLGQKRPLIIETIDRVAEARFHPPIVILNQRHRHLIARLAARHPTLPMGRIILEPVARNTAASIAVGVLHLIADRGDGVILALPSDHLIEYPERFYHAIDAALPLARQDAVVLFGAAPDFAACDYGYIEKGAAIAAHAFRVKGFTEKPDAASAARYLAKGNFLWNTGMFVFRASVMKSLFARLAPDLLEHAAQALRESAGDDAIDLGASFARAEAIAFDYAIMEKIDNACVIPVDMGWRDIGSWRALAGEIKRRLRLGG